MGECGSCKAPVRAGAPFCAVCGTHQPVEGTPAATPDPLLGLVLARKFRIRDVLGEGGMGRVYRAEQLPLGVDVVIKTLHAHLAGDATLVGRFFREAQAASRLRHPNTVSLLDFGDADGTIYIAMELVRGRSLARVLEDDGRFEPRRVLRVVLQVLDVLAAAHAVGIVHRDLKPDNVMIEDLASHRDFVKVLDFGIAKLADAGGEKLTKTGMLFGTPSYMAPEQATGATVDGRTDLYSLGVIMYELLVGTVPFSAPTLPALLVAVASTPAPPILAARPDLPPGLAAVIDSLLAKEPAARPSSALDLKATLEALDLVAPVRPAAVAREVAAVVLACPRCRHVQAATVKFCGECGAAMSAPLAEPKLAELKRYLPTDVVDDLAALRTRTAGEKRDVVVLVVDLAGEHPRELVAQLGEIAVRHTGILDRRPGAGLVIAFGVAVTHADDAERAVEAALEISRLADGATCAIHAGTIIADPTASAGYTAVGDTIDLPTRIAGAVPGGKLVVTDRVRRQIRSSVDLRQLPALRIKGQAAPVPVHEVTSKTVATRAPLVGLARTPFVGRADGIRAITAAIESEPGEILHVTGEPGIGKSRLLAELTRSGTVIVAPARGAVGAILAALGGTTDAMRALGLPIEDIRILHAFLDGRRAPAELEPQRARAAAACVLAVLGMRAHTAVVIDDVQTADPLTRQLVRLHAADPTPGVTLVTAARTGHPLPWDDLDSPAVRVATLGALPDAAIENLVAGALSPTPAPREVQAAVVARAGGSPLMALEVLRGFIDARVLVSIGGRWSLVGDVASVPPPEGLATLYAARLDALPAYARDIVAAAAVIGEEMPLALLERVVAAPHGAPIGREVRLLVARGIFADAADPTRVRFAEPSAREAAYARLAPPLRHELHSAVALALDAAPAGPGHDAIAIAEHFEAAGETARALDHYARAIAARPLPLQRRQILERSRPLARLLADDRRLADDCLRLAETYLDLGELSELKAVLVEGLACAHRVDDQALIARLRAARGRASLATGAIDAALADFETAIAASVGGRDRVLTAELHGDLAEAHERRGDLATATDTFLRALELVQTAPGDPRPLVVRFLAALGRVVLRTRDLDRAERFLTQALVAADELEDRPTAAKVLGNLAAVAHARADHAKALELAQRSLEIARDLGDLVGIARQLTNLGTLRSQRGDVAGARRCYDEAFAQAQRAGWREGMATAAAARERT